MRADSRHLTGTISELVVAADLMAKGYEVFRGLCAQSSCDLITLKDGQFQRVEVKTDNRNPGMTIFHRNIGKFDIAALYSPETGKIEYRSVYDLKGLKSPETCGNFETEWVSQVIEKQVV